MQAGRLRHQLQLQSLQAGSPQQKPTGEPDKSWTTVATCYAEIRKLRGIARFTAQQEQAGVEVEIEVRYRSGVTAGMRWLHGSVIYDIKNVDETHKHVGKLITECSTGLNDGG